jgi:asparagine synthase (glutamine-hydrolysing)
MCGLTGWLSWRRPPAAGVVEAMSQRLRHRGPDASGIAAVGPVVLGHRRLSIIDLSAAANQPMWDASRRLLMIFNGEIYNFKDLRAELEQRGVGFRTASDTEVMLEAYRCWGVDFVERLNGMFAFALWDEDRQALLLARDRMGEKPLFMADDGDGGVVFASEIGALRAHPAVGRRMDPRALGQYLALNYTLGDACLLAGVTKLPPAHLLLLERGRAAVPRRYWDLAPHFRNKARHASQAAAARDLDELIEDSVRLRMIADVPVGVFLSGGIDSSTVTAAMARIARPDRVQSFSIGFREETFSELAEARAAASHLGVNHHDRLVDLANAPDLTRLVHAAGEPVADSSLIPTFFLAGFARGSVTVCLSGDGGDEVMAGYETYAADKLRQLARFLPAAPSQAMASALERLWPASFAKLSTEYKLIQFLRGRALDADRAHYFWRTIFAEDERMGLLRPDRRQAVLAEDPFTGFATAAREVADCHYLDRAMYMDMKTYLPEDILVKVDRATMAHSLESRAPFLDHRLVEFCASLPVDWKLRGWRKKHLLKRSQREHLPAGLLNRPKKGFSAPVAHWLAGGLRDRARAVTLEGPLTDWIEPRAVESLWAQHLARRRDNGLKLFGLTCLGLWLEDLAAAPPAPAAVPAAGAA